MVALRILVPPVRVRVLPGQLNKSATPLFTRFCAFNISTEPYKKPPLSFGRGVTESSLSLKQIKIRTLSGISLFLYDTGHAMKLFTFGSSFLGSCVGTVSVDAGSSVRQSKRVPSFGSSFLGSCVGTVSVDAGSSVGPCAYETKVETLTDIISAATDNINFFIIPHFFNFIHSIIPFFVQ